MKTTPFTDVHIALGAKMHEFAGFNMPIEYTGIIDEHMTVVNGVGVFDVSHMGEFWVKGPNALAFIQSVTSTTLPCCRSAKLNILAFRMTRAVSWTTCWSIIMNRKNTFWLSMRVTSPKIGIGA